MKMCDVCNKSEKEEIYERHLVSKHIYLVPVEK